MTPALLGSVTLLLPLDLPRPRGRAQLESRLRLCLVGSLSPAHTSINKPSIKYPLLSPLSPPRAETLIAQAPADVTVVKQVNIWEVNTHT